MEEYLKCNACDDFKALAEHSEMAMRAVKDGKSFDMLTLYDNWDGSIYGNGDARFSFHPNGKSGCIELDDDYMFDYRFNHMIWVEGDNEEGNDAIILLVNHKGTFSVCLITIHDTYKW